VSEKHTPGPWDLWVDKEGAFTIRAEPEDGMVIAKRNVGTNDPAEGIANAHLIAAAPELLEALKSARQFIVNGTEYGYIRMPDKDCPDSAHDTLPKIQAAIAKAEGQ